MASAPDTVQINVEDFSKDEKPLATKLSGVLNSWFLEVSEIFNKRFTFGENFSGSTPTIRVTGGKPITFKYQGPGVPRLLFIGQFRPVSTTTEILTVPVSLPQWSFDGRGNITIQAIPGLTNLAVYDIVLTITTG